MNLIRGTGGLCPCPKCLVPHGLLSNLQLKFPLRTKEHSLKIRQAVGSQRLQRDREMILKAFSMRPVEVKAL